MASHIMTFELIYRMSCEGYYQQWLMVKDAWEAKAEKQNYLFLDQQSRI